MNILVDRKPIWPQHYPNQSDWYFSEWWCLSSSCRSGSSNHHPWPQKDLLRLHWCGGRYRRVVRLVKTPARREDRVQQPCLWEYGYYGEEGTELPISEGDEQVGGIPKIRYWGLYWLWLQCRYLALVCIMGDDNPMEKKVLIDYNVGVFQEALAKVFGWWERHKRINSVL